VIKHWKHISTRILAETPIFTLNAHRRSSQETGRQGDFYVLDAGDWVNVVAVTRDDRIVLVEQYRHGVRRTTLEIPGGMIDASDESPEHAARRELLEETGFASDNWRCIGIVDPNPAIQSNRCHTFLALDSEQVSEPAPDGNEELRLVLEPVSSIRTLAAEGRIEHALVVAALYWWELSADERGSTPVRRSNP